MKRSRSRDVYDIWAICDYFTIRVDMFLPLVKSVFDAKRVSLELLGRFRDLKSLHGASWPNVELSVSHELDEFDYYFEFVASTADKLYTKWKENPP